MLYELIRRSRPALGALLLGSVYSIASPAFASCDVTGRDMGFGFFNCDVDGVNIKLTGPSGSVTLDDFILDPTDGEGYVQVFASDTEADPTDITVNLTGNTVVTNTNYDGLDIRTVRGDIVVNIGDGVTITPEQTGIYVKSSDDVAGANSGKYVGGNVTITNRGTVVGGPEASPMGTNGIVGLANGGAVSISNYGTVTTSNTNFSDPWDTYGILADGGGSSSALVQVDIYNDGTVSALNDGMRVNSYNGLGKVVNDVNGVITSAARRGVVVWSNAELAELENRGSITALDGTGINVWGAKGATATNSGKIFSFNDPNATGGTSTFVGAHVWAQTSEDATLVNTATGSIVARDGYGAWMQSQQGDVILTNAGLIKGQYNAVMVTGDGLNELAVLTGEDQVEDYEGAQSGDVTITNSGILTAYGLAEDGAANRALVTIAGVNLGTVELRNEIGGVIGAGIDLDNGFDRSLLDGPASDLDGLQAALGNYAVKIGAQSGLMELSNAGTILGRVSVGLLAAEFGEGPGGGNYGYFSNSGLWATTGQSALASMRNTGTIWAQGETSVTGELRNETGMIVLSATALAAAKFTVGNEFTGGGTLALNIGAGARLGDDPLLNVVANASGSTSIEIMSLDGWDWTDTGRLDVAQVAGLSLEEGDSTFVMEDQVRGFALYTLDYTEEDQLWSIEASLHQASVEEVATLADVISTSILDVSSDLLERTDALRDDFWSAGNSEPMAYAATAQSPADEAISGALSDDGRPALRTWAHGRGAVGGNDDYSGQKSDLSFGADVSAQVDDVFLAAGVFGTIAHTGLDYDGSGSTAGIDAQALGAYGTAMWTSGLFVSGVVALENASVDLNLSGAEASFDAQLQGGRIDVGYRTQIGDLDIEPSIGLTYGHTAYDDFQISSNTVSLDDADTLAAEARLRLSKTFETDTADISPFAVLMVGSRDVEDGVISLAGLGAVGTLEDGGLYGGVSAGVQVTSIDGSLSGFARADLKATEQSQWSSIKLGGSYRF